MPIYRAKIKCFVGNSLREVDEEFEYNGEYCKHLELVSGQEPQMPVASTTPVQTQVKTSNLELMTKAELEVYGRTIGIELDRRQTKVTLIKQLEAARKQDQSSYFIYRGLVVLLLTSSFYRRCNGN